MKTVSCVMVTRNRFELWKRSLNAFLAQDYPARQLVVHVDRDAEGLSRMQHYLKANSIENVVLQATEDQVPLGTLRNRSVERADGEVICQWDDDDLYHPQRLSRQLAAMLEADAEVSYLEEYFALYGETGSLYWCDYYRTGLPGMPSTLLAYKAALPTYSSVRIHEDTLLQRTMQNEQKRILPVRGLAGLHIYVAHGENTSSASHMQGLWRSIGHEKSTLCAHQAEVESWLAAYPSLPDLTVRSYREEEVFRFSQALASAA